MTVLVDTSIWVDHFKHKNENLIGLLLSDQVYSHPMIIAELACGTPPAPRERTLDDINQLQKANQATLDEVMSFIERERIYGLGCGLVDLCILTSTLITPNARLWTLDRRLSLLSKRFNVSYQLS